MQCDSSDDVTNRGRVLVRLTVEFLGHQLQNHGPSVYQRQLSTSEYDETEPKMEIDDTLDDKGCCFEFGLSTNLFYEPCFRFHARTISRRNCSDAGKFCRPFFRQRGKGTWVFFRVALFFRDKAGKESMANTITIMENSPKLMQTQSLSRCKKI